MTTSRIYAYRWPARLVSHKPFAAERYSITSSCIWQVFFRKNADFLFFICSVSSPGRFSVQNAQSGGSFFCGKPRSGDRMPVLRSFYTKNLSVRRRQKTNGKFKVFLPLVQSVLAFFEKSRHADAQRLKSGYFFAFAFSSSRSFSLGVTYTVVYTS